MKLTTWLLTSLLIVALLTSCTSSTHSPLSEEEAIFQEVLRSNNQFTSNGNNCSKILETEPWCSVVLAVTNVMRPEWTSLFPTTKFFLVKRNVLSQETGFQRNWLIAKQDERKFTAETFDQILATNGITITDTNRELVAKAFVLMTLPDYLENSIAFSDAEMTDERGIFSFERFNYTITAWTETQGLKVNYLFFIKQGQIKIATWNTSEYGTGRYVEMPSRELPTNQQGTLRFP